MYVFMNEKFISKLIQILISWQGHFGCPEKDATIAASAKCSAINMVPGL